GSPFRCTVHAPQSAAPQPNLVPVMPSVSRSTQSSGVFGSTLTCLALPLTVRLIMNLPSLSRWSVSTVEREYPARRMPRQPKCRCVSPPPLPAQLEALDLARRGLRQLGQELDPARVFVRRKALLDVLLQRSCQRRVAGAPRL